jgi:hypothetical protein
VTPRLDRFVLQRRPDRRVVDLDPGRGQIAEQLADHVLVAGFLEVGADHVLGISFGLDLGQAHLPGSPLAE